MVNYLGVIQARMSSSRLPAKVMLDLAGKPLLVRVIECAQKTRGLDAIVVVTSVNQEDNAIAFLCEELGVNVYRGDLNHVLSRFVAVADLFKAKHIVRITADNPLTFPEWIDKLIVYYQTHASGYSGCQGLPYGGAAEVFSREMLNHIALNYNDALSQEHVTDYMASQPSAKPYRLDFDYHEIRATIDTLKDYCLINQYFWQCKQKKQNALDLKNFIAYIEGCSI